MDINKGGVAGLGLMGHGITQVAAQAGYQVVAREVDDATIQKGMGKIEKQLARAVEKGKLEQAAADEIRGRISTTTGYDGFEDCDLVIEVITESLPKKLELWKDRDGPVKDGAVFATNTSSLSVIDQAAPTGRAHRLTGPHFFTPAQVMPLLEVVQTVTADEGSLAAGLAFGERGKKLTGHAKDKTGFIVNRLLVPYM